jgi:alpha-1,2-mannosyltransferase
VLTRLPRAGVPVLAVVVAVTTYLAMRGDLVDLSVYRYAGQALLDGRSVYGSDDPVTGLPFTYPPFAAVVMVPVALVPGPAAAAVWTGASVCALAAVVTLSLRTLGQSAPGWLVALLTLGAVALEPVWQNLTFGQVNLLLMLAVLVDLLLPDRRWSGVLVGVAAGVKLTPLVFVVLLVMVGRRTAAGRAVLTFALTVALGAALTAGSAPYWGDRLLDPGRVGPPALAHNQSAYGVLTRIFDGPPPPLLWLAVAGALSAVALVCAARWWLRGERLLGTCLGAMAMLAASPVSWSHHWVWAVPVSIVLWTRARGVCLAWVAVFVVRPFVWLPYGAGREYEWTWWQHLVGDAYFWCALGLVVWAVQAASSKPTAGLPGITVGGQSHVSSQGK